jgi:Tfp pilus assembly protein PilX
MNSKLYKTYFRLVNNEDGFVLVASLLIMLILVIMGIAANNTTTIEFQIAGNEKVSEQTFYVAESAWQRGFQRIENSGDKALKFINPTDPTDDTVAAAIDQPLHGAISYSYITARIGLPEKVPGSGKDYFKFTYQIDSSASGVQSSSKVVRVVIQKVSK